MTHYESQDHVTRVMSHWVRVVGVKSLYKEESRSQ